MRVLGAQLLAADRFRVFHVPRVLALISVDGRVGIASRKVNAAALDVPVHAERRFAFDSDPTGGTPVWADGRRDWGGRGLQFLRHDQMTSWQWRVWVPLPYLAAALAPMPAWWLLGRRRDLRRRKQGRCPACGYDMRATRGRCPECGRSARTPA